MLANPVNKIILLAATNTVISPRHRFTRASSLGILPLPQAMSPTIAAPTVRWSVTTDHAGGVAWKGCQGRQCAVARSRDDVLLILTGQSNCNHQPFPGA
jgi:hypothetical protein